MKRLMELQTREQTLQRENEDILYAMERLQNELQEQETKLDRA